jgi:hypothetical protein
MGRMNIVRMVIEMVIMNTAPMAIEKEKLNWILLVGTSEMFQF